MVFRLPDGGPVRVRTSNTASETPTPAELEEGEVALNAADGVLYFQGTSGSVGPVGFQDAPEDEIIYGRKDGAWVDITAPANLQVRRGTASEVAAITPLEGEPVWTTDTKTLVVGDGTTLGGLPIGSNDLVAYSLGTLDVNDTVANDTDMLLVLPTPGVYFVKLAYRFIAAGSPASLTITLPLGLPYSSGVGVTYVSDVSPNDVYGEDFITIGTGSATEWYREFVCITSVANTTISPNWVAQSGSTVSRLPSYSFAIPFA